MSSRIIINAPLFLLCVVLSVIYYYPAGSVSDSCHIHQHILNSDREFQQRNKIFWEFNEQTSSWVQVGLPHDLVSCNDGVCKVVASIQESRNKAEDRRKEAGWDDDDDARGRENKPIELVELPLNLMPVRSSRISLTKMSETSIWVTGRSGSIYERLWNGLQWVVAPHGLPFSAGYAVSVFMLNQTIFALSESGMLYQMQFSEDSQAVWTEFKPEVEDGKNKETAVQNSVLEFKSGVVSSDKKRMYLCSKNGLVFQVAGVDSWRLMNHGRPPGANIVAITDADTVRTGLVFAVSDAGDLYEYDQTSKPPWKKHRSLEESTNHTTSLASIGPCCLHGLVGAQSVSLFLLTKLGELVERRLHHRKWKWLVHGNPKGHILTSITCIPHQEVNDRSNTLFFTAAEGFVFEYHIQKDPGRINADDSETNWLNYDHPPHAKVALGISGLQLQSGRLIFPLDDGRLGELHFPGIGGENSAPHSAAVSSRRRSQSQSQNLRYVWSLLDAPESEGWNAEYCIEERGPSNCILGTKEANSGISSSSKWRKDSRTQPYYLLHSSSSDPTSSSFVKDDKADVSPSKLFRLRLIQDRTSFFIIPDNGLTLEYLYDENNLFWLRHDFSSTRMSGVLGFYNGSLFLVDDHGSLLIRETSATGDLAWINCTAIRKGRRVIGGPPWDRIPGQERRARPDDAIFFVSRSGRLLQFTVALREFKWKDCKNPPGTRISKILDQELFRENIVFVVGRNGRLYQYNKVTQLWHEHQQSQHLVLSRSPGTAMRPSTTSLRGSIFMLSEHGGLVEYKWSTTEGWNWIEHGTPDTNVTIIGAPGPCFGGNDLFLIGSDGNVYLRFMDQGEWKWRDCGFPQDADTDHTGDDDEVKEFAGDSAKNEETSVDGYCNPKVASTRPMPFSEDAVIFELEDGRLAEMRRTEGKGWQWSRTIVTPTSSCAASIRTSMAL